MSSLRNENLHFRIKFAVREGKRTAALAAIQKPAPVGTVSETPLEAILETLSRRVSPSSSQDWFSR